MQAVFWQTWPLNWHRKGSVCHGLLVASKSLPSKSLLAGMKQCMIGVYRPLKVSCANDYIRLEEEQNDVFTWASLQKELLIITGD